MKKEKTEDYYFIGDKMVFTEKFLRKRGYCCGSGCRHCPYTPKHQKGNTVIKDLNT